jgi:hypothetical protein
MANKKGVVTGEVFDRVRLDYQSRNEALEDQARPLKDQARAEYAKLRSLHGQCMLALEAARLDKEELEFRHELGEFKKDSFAQELEECKKGLEDRGSELAEAEKMMERFVQAFHSKEELEAPLLEASAEEAAADEPEAEEEELPEEPPVEEPPAEEEAAPEEEAAFEEEAIPVEEPTEEPVADDALDEAEPFSDPAADEPEVDVDSTSALEAPDQSETTPGQPMEGATMVAGGPRLVAQTDDGRTQEFTLGVTSTSIGRAPENAIQLIDESVSRQHAEIVLDADGYLLRDLGSGNGTYVNGERISEYHIINGDVVQIGTATFVFREV